MNYNTYKKQLTDQMQAYLLFMLDCDDPDDASKLHAEVHRLKDRIDEINRLHYTQQRKQLQTVTMTVESGIKFK